MNNMWKIPCLLLVISALLWGCGTPAPTETTQTPTEATTEPTTEATTEPPTEAPTLPPITSEDALRQALETEIWVTMESDITLTKPIDTNGRMLNGGGYTITGIPYVEDDPATENALLVTGGQVENVRILDAYQCIGNSDEYPARQDVRVKNVYADSYLIAMSFCKGNRTTSLFVEDCTLLGWTLVNRLKSAQFTNCTFGWGSNGKGGHFRPYVDTTFIGCHFEGKTKPDGKYVPFNLSFYSSTDGLIITFEDCYAGDTLITQDNIHKLLKINSEKNQIVVYNTAG